MLVSQPKSLCCIDQSSGTVYLRLGLQRILWNPVDQKMGLLGQIHTIRSRHEITIADGFVLDYSRGHD